MKIRPAQIVSVTALAIAVIFAGFVTSVADAAPAPATFGQATLYHIDSKLGTAFDLASGDFTGTGIKDIAVADGAGGSVSLLAGKGDGTFAAAAIVYSDPGKSATALAVGDFNGDGKLDLAVVTEGSTQDVVLLLGDGRRHFRVSARAPLRFLNAVRPFPYGGVRSIAAGRFARRARQYLIVSDGVNYVSEFPGDGKGGLGPRRDLLAAALPTALVVANVFGNGRADVALIDNDSPSVYAFASHGDGTFAARQRSPLGTLPINAQPVSLAAGDFRGLGRTDLFVVDNATPRSGLTIGKILLNDGHGSYAKAADVRLAQPNYGFPWTGAVGDFNGDGIADLTAVIESFPSQNDLVVLPGNGDGTFSRSTQTLVRIRFNPRRGFLIPDKMIVDDFNGDGKPDVAVAFDRTPGEGVAVLLNTSKRSESALGRS